MSDRHVMPVDGEHESIPTCWCQPVIDYENPLTGDRVYVHRRTMDGPAYEREVKTDEGLRRLAADAFLRLFPSSEGGPSYQNDRLYQRLGDALGLFADSSEGEEPR